MDNIEQIQEDINFKYKAMYHNYRYLVKFICMNKESFPISPTKKYIKSKSQ